MRSLFLIITILFCQISFAQTTKIKIKKEEPIAKVSLAGADTGIVTITKILCDKKLMIANNKYNLKIYYYFASIIDDSNNQVGPIFEGNNDKLQQAMIDAITERTKSETIRLKFERIKAYNEFNETINLNEINIRVDAGNKK